MDETKQTQPHHNPFPPTVHGLPLVLIRLVSATVVLSLLLERGFLFGRQRPHLVWLHAALGLLLLADLLGALPKGRAWREVVVSRRFEFVLLFMFAAIAAAFSNLGEESLVSLVAFFHLATEAELWANLLDFLLLFLVVVQMLRGAQRLLHAIKRPEVILAASFGVLILGGTLLLMLPSSSVDPEKPITALNAFFTATSAGCVTGLVVRDTGSEFSVFGQMVILLIFQVGGLGIITFVALLSIFSSRSLPLSQMLVFRHVVNAPKLSELKKQILAIVLATVLIELIGAALIYHSVPSGGDVLNHLRWSFFHSASAFCNAGFALQPTSLEPHAANLGVSLTVMALIVLGGLGFLVIPDLLRYRITRSTFFRRFSFFRRLHQGYPPDRLSLHSRLALTLTALLLAIGTVGFLFLESGHLLARHTWGESLLLSAFQSVTTRTAGFNTVPIHELQSATLIFMMLLMVIGANPVSTGGGIKTVSFAILLLALRAMISRRERVEAFGRTLPLKTLLAALSVFVIYVISASLGLFLLALFDPQLPLRDQFFEVISALSTVGLSTGITAQLSPAGQLTLCALMFVGRIGPISLVLSIFQSKRTVVSTYPEEDVIVG